MIEQGPREACGVFGIYAPGRDVARMTFFALYALQHRGQESAGIVTCDGKGAMLHKGMGLVSQVFNEANLKPLGGHLAVGHTRYSTTGSSHPRNAQPIVIETIHGPLGVAHNGNLVNTRELRQKLLERGVGLVSGSDSEAITQILAAPPEVWGEHGDDEGDRWLASIRALMRVAKGSYCLTILTRKAIYAVRDPMGIRPLCLGEVDTGWAVASESCALETIGARLLREVEPGEIVRIDKRGIQSFRGAEPERRAFCVFEYVYLARPDSIIEGRGVHEVRRRFGEALAREAPVEADVVVGVPDSAISAAIGYSLASGIPYTEGLIKNRYIGRTFIQPDDALRKVGVGLKYNPLHSNLEGKRVVLVDDSIVRGNTAGPLVDLLRSGGAAEVHVRVASPPVRHPCFLGVDMATRNELVAHRLDVEGIRKWIRADSLAYLTHEGMLEAVGEGLDDRRGRCTACFSGSYPMPIPERLFAEESEKEVLETVWQQKAGV
ncbi:MAG: amidophosphoribosyltransferase [Vulcanimicrobiota bacterium]